MTKYKLYIIFTSIIAGGLFVVFFVVQGYYPVALVGNTLISARTLSREYQAATLYYENMVKTYPELFEGKKMLTPQEIEVSVMGQLVEDILVHKGAARMIGAELEGLVGEKIGKYANDEELQKAAAVLYGLGKDDFVKSILVPQAEREVFEGRLVLESKNIDEWLAEEKKSARVIFFSPQFTWDGEGVVGTE